MVVVYLSFDCVNVVARGVMLRDDHDLANRLEEEDDGFLKLVNVAEDLDINKGTKVLSRLTH
jgi:hypothetical protein